MPMNIARASSIGNPAAATTTPPSSEEYVFQSRLTVCTSSAVVTDQKPASSGSSSKLSVQWIGQPLRSSLKSSCGGPSCHSSRPVSSTLFRSRPTVAMRTSEIAALDVLESYWLSGQFRGDEVAPRKCRRRARLQARLRRLVYDGRLAPATGSDPAAAARAGRALLRLGGDAGELPGAPAAGRVGTSRPRRDQ